MVLGGNCSPDYVIEDLDLDVLNIPGVEIAWRSSRPEILDENGKVTRPAGGVPVGVELKAVISAGATTASTNLFFRTRSGRWG